MFVEACSTWRTRLGWHWVSSHVRLLELTTWRRSVLDISTPECESTHNGTPNAKSSGNNCLYERAHKKRKQQHKEHDNLSCVDKKTNYKSNSLCYLATFSLGLISQSVHIWITTTENAQKIKIIILNKKKKRTLKAEFKKYKVNERSEWNGKHNTNISWLNHLKHLAFFVYVYPSL